MNSFGYILWYQSNTNKKDKLIMDNRILLEKDTIDKVFRYIFPNRESPSIKWKQLNFLCSHKTSLECFYDKRGYFLFKSHFNEKDNLGRLIPFVICISANNFNSARDLMKDIIKRNEMTLLEEDLLILDSYKRLWTIYYLKILCLGILVLIPICAFVIKLFLQDSSCE